jgi:hypothetical protein
MFRLLVFLALIAAPGPVLARPAKAPPKTKQVVVVPAAPVCTRVRRKAFNQAEGWSVKTVSLACKTVVAVASQPGSKNFTSLRTSKDVKSK